MKVFTCNDFKGAWPVGTAAVIVADNIGEARAALMAELSRLNLPQGVDPITIHQVHTSKPQVIILCDGDY